MCAGIPTYTNGMGRGLIGVPSDDNLLFMHERSKALKVGAGAPLSFSLDSMEMILESTEMISKTY